MQGKLDTLYLKANLADVNVGEVDDWLAGVRGQAAGELIRYPSPL